MYLCNIKKLSGGWEDMTSKHINLRKKLNPFFDYL
jgi:hypothetical protein